MNDLINIDELKRILSNFANVRDWQKFHNPKNLAMALAAEAGELLEIFQWLTELESAHIKDDNDGKTHVAHELADILLYMVRLADQLDINLNQAIANKLASNNAKYPADQFKGSAKKYTEYLG